MNNTTSSSQGSTRIACAVLAAIAGAVAGHFVFLWIAQQGFYALVLPGH